MLKIDAFCHIMPRPYYDRFFELDARSARGEPAKRVSRTFRLSSTWTSVSPRWTSSATTAS